jgi:hypothetical protein
MASFAGGLASPPESPQVLLSSHPAAAFQRMFSPQPIHKCLDLPVVLSSPTSSAVPSEPPAPSFFKPSDPDVTMALGTDELGKGKAEQSMQVRAASPSPSFIKPTHPDVAMDLNEQSTQVRAASPSPSFIKPTRPDVAMDLDEDEPTEAESPHRDLEPELKSARRSRNSSLSSSTDASDMEVDDQPSTAVQLAAAEDSEVSEDESDSENGGDNHITEELDSSDGQKDEGTIDDHSNDDALSDRLAEVGLHRSSRNKQTPQVLTPIPVPTIVVRSKRVGRKERFCELVSF